MLTYARIGKGTSPYVKIPSYQHILVIKPDQITSTTYLASDDTMLHEHDLWYFEVPDPRNLGPKTFLSRKKTS